MCDVINSIFLASLLFSLLRNRSMPVFYGFKQSTLAKEGLTTNRTVPCSFAALWKLWRQSTWPTLAKQSPIINTMLKTGRVQRTSKAEYKRLLCTEGSRVTQWFLLGVCFFPLIEELHNKQPPLYGTSSDFCFWEMRPSNSRLQGAPVLHTAANFTFISFP